jgi:hypothetical protein
VSHGIDSSRVANLSGESDMRRISAVPHQNTVFRQLIQFIPFGTLDELIEQTEADKRTRRLSTKQQLLAMLFGQFSGARSLRDLEALSESHGARRYHGGLPVVHRSTLADANARRPVAVFTGLFSALVFSLERKQRREAHECVHLIDSTTMSLSDLCRSWAGFSADANGVKAHVDFEAQSGRPVWLAITPSRVNDITAAKAMPIQPGATYVFDLGYYDYAWWAALNEAGCVFVTRLKKNTPLRLIENRAVAAESNILSDRIGFLPERLAASRQNPFQQAVREITVRLDDGRPMRIVSNDLDAPAETIAALYKRRWMIELFFRWVKQTLKLRHFLGTSENAVRIHIAIAMIAFLLIHIAHTARAAGERLTEFARLVSANLMHRKRLDQLRHGSRPTDPMPAQNNRQMALLWS